ncbi:MAG: hypothetical protein ACKV0T_05695, partial [Planctomycetales bacterium]
MIRPTIPILKKRPPGGTMNLFKWLTSGAPPENLSEVIARSPTMGTRGLGEDAWELDPDEVIALRRKIADSGRPLSKWPEAKVLRGVLTGLTEVFVINEATRERLISEEVGSAALIKPYAQGTHVRPWYIEHNGQFLLAIRSSANATWPWSHCATEA